MPRRLVVLSAVLLLALASPALANSPEEDLWQAAREGDVARVRALLEAGVAVDAKTEFECTALYFAANSNHPEVIKVLLAAGADVNASDNSYGFSAISMAAWLGNTEAVEALLAGGASPGDAIGGLFAAAGNGHANTVRALLGKLELPADQLNAVLATAQRSGHDEVAALLQKAGAQAPPPVAAADSPTPSADAHASAKSEPEGESSDAVLDRPIPVAKPANWPEFRGAGRTGIADGQHPPMAFDLDSGHHVRWRTAIEGLGLSSPIIWGNRIFITTAVSPQTEQSVDDNGLGLIAAVDETARHEWQLLAYDLRNGELLWKRTAHAGVPRSQRHWKASQANPTCATDGKTVVALFGSEGLFAYDLEGKQLWHQDLGTLNAGWYLDEAFGWGFASSPILDDGRVIVQVDVHGDSFVAAFELATGRELWRTAREAAPSWGTPLVYRGGDSSELVLAATHAIIGYAPATGRELWRIRGNSAITVASPIAQDGLIVATGGYRTPKPIYAVKPGARGDITPPEDGANAHVAWSTQSDGAYQVTPLLYRGVLYVLRDNGVLTAYEPSSGEQLFRHRVGGRYTASPVATDGRIYLTAEDGDVTVLQAGRSFRVLAKSELDAASLATPAIANGTIVFRTVKGLIGVGFQAQRQASHIPEDAASAATSSEDASTNGTSTDDSSTAAASTNG